MKRTIKRDIRWNQDEIDRINAAREHTDFSDFVRDAAMDKVIAYESLTTEKPKE